MSTSKWPTTGPTPGSEAPVSVSDRQKSPAASPAGHAWYVKTPSNVASRCAPFAGASACADGIPQHAADNTPTATAAAALLMCSTVVSPSSDLAGIPGNGAETDVRLPVQGCAGPARGVQYWIRAGA